MTPETARRYLVGQLAAGAPAFPTGAEGVRALLRRLRCIQLDPLDPIGTNADLVALARVDGIARGDVYRHLLPGHAFEHFAKERCLLPADAFPYYRDRAAQTPWWRLTDRLKRLPQGVVEAVRAEVADRGPISARHLTDRGRVEAIDWSGWRGTPKASKMALEVLWTRCQVVVCGRAAHGKVYDVPQRALPAVADAPAGDFGRWALLERVEAAGLLARASGPWWSMLQDLRTGPLVEDLLAGGDLVQVTVEGSSRPYLAPADVLDRTFPEPDDRLRILGPLDPLIWDRKLVSHVFGFDYVWEVYKPAERRQFGWYVCPLLHRGHLVGRLEARVADGALVVDNLWREPGRALDEAALDQALARHASACGVAEVRR